LELDIDEDVVSEEFVSRCMLSAHPDSWKTEAHFLGSTYYSWISGHNFGSVVVLCLV
jgi:hypothetical protein